jgi:hypothetical protein
MGGDRLSDQIKGMSHVPHCGTSDLGDVVKMLLRVALHLTATLLAGDNHLSPVPTY